MYDVFILALMMVGISSVVVCSYKIFHSRVHPVGMVRKIPSSPQRVDEASAGLLDLKKSLQAELVSLLGKGWSTEEIARDLHLSEEDIKDYIQRMTWEAYARRGFRVHSGKQQYIVTVGHSLAQNPFHEREESALEEEVVEQGEALKSHSKQLEEIEKRIRRLEIESVQKLQEATEEKPQPPVVH